jgi:hypothetical protein
LIDIFSEMIQMKRLRIWLWGWLSGGVVLAIGLQAYAWTGREWIFYATPAAAFVALVVSNLIVCNKIK